MLESSIVESCGWWMQIGTLGRLSHVGGELHVWDGNHDDSVFEQIAAFIQLGDSWEETDRYKIRCDHF